jgi:hypothetical protein
MALGARGRICGAGVGTEVVDVAETEVLDATAWIFFSERVEYILAVIAAPEAALTAAMMAMVVLDILRSFELEGAHTGERDGGYLYGRLK